jgi:hypothetical protein
VSLRNAAVGVGASHQSSKVSSKVLPVPLTDVCFSRSVRSGNDGRPGVVSWGSSMSLHSAVSCANIISVFALMRVWKGGLRVSSYVICFWIPASPHRTVANVRWSYLIALSTSLNLPRHVRAVLLQG